jgi:hypothetical protein
MNPASGLLRAASGEAGARVANLAGLLPVALLLVASACATAPKPAAPATEAPKTQTAEAAGTCDDPIVIHAANEGEGIRKEGEWIRAHYGPFTKNGQGLGRCKGKAADSIDFTTTTGKKHTVWFDISEWFGKF